MSPLAHVADEHAGEVAIVTVEGEVDASNVRDVGDRLRSALDNRSHALVVDLLETTYMDSAGINLLFALDRELRQRRQELHLVVRPGSAVARVSDITGMDRTIAVHAARDAAVAAATR